MKQVKVSFSFQYDRCELSTGEHQPEIYAFLDARFKRKPTMLKFTLDENNPNKVYKGTVTGYVNSRVGSLPPTTALVFTHWAWRPNQWGSNELQGVGTNHVTFGEMVHQRTFEKEVPLLMHTVNNREKGQIRFQLHQIELGGVEISAPLFVSAYSGAQVKVDQATKCIGEYAANVMQLEENMNDTFSGTNRIRVPYNLSESGLEMTSGLPLPAYSYVLGEIPESNTRFWENCFQQVMKRDGLIPSDFFQLNKSGKARVMANMVTYVPTMLDYVSDTVMTDNRMERAQHRVEAQGIELFGDSLGPALSGDCEDLGTGIQMCHEALIRHTFPSTSTTFDALKEIQQIANEYLVLLSLDVVNGAHVQQKDAPKGAHMNANLVPFYQFKQVLENSPEGKKVSRELPWPTHIQWDAELPFMVGEGTGIYEPLGLDADKALLPVKSYVYQGTPSMGTAKKPIGHARNEKTQFFLGSLLGMTPYFYRKGSPYAAFWYTNGRQQQRGAKYTDMIANRTDAWGLRPQPRIPRLLRKIVDEAILVRQPSYPLVLSERTSHPATNADLDYVVRTVGKNTQHATTGLLGQSVRGIIKVPMYVRPGNINAEIARHNAKDFKRLKHVVKVEYDMEEATDRVYAYRVVAHVAV